MKQIAVPVTQRAFSSSNGLYSQNKKKGGVGSSRHHQPATGAAPFRFVRGCTYLVDGARLGLGAPRDGTGLSIVEKNGGVTATTAVSGFLEASPFAGIPNHPRLLPLPPLQP